MVVKFKLTVNVGERYRYDEDRLCQTTNIKRHVFLFPLLWKAAVVSGISEPVRISKNNWRTMSCLAKLKCKRESICLIHISFIKLGAISSNV